MTPTLDSDKTDTNRTLTRRRAVATLAGASAVGLGVGAAALGSAPARAQVDSEFTIPDATYEAADAAPTPIVEADATVAYQVPRLEAVVVQLVAGRDSADTVLATERIETSVTEADTDVTLTGPLTDADAFAASDFAPAAESTTTVNATVGVTVEIVDSDDSVVAADTATDTLSIEVTNTAEAVEVAVSGTGSIRFEASDGGE